MGSNVEKIKQEKYETHEFKCDDMTRCYMMISFLIYPIKEKNILPYFYITKLYLNYAEAVMRMNENDILEYLPLFFENKSGLRLEREQINDLRLLRKTHAQQFDVDVVIEQQLNQYLS